MESFKPSELIEPTGIANRYKTKRREKLTLSETIDIVDKIKFKWIPYKDVAKEYRISIPTISQLMTKLRKDKNYIQSLAHHNW